MDDEPKAEVITPPDTLKNKVKTGGPGAVDLDTLKRAEAVIADMTDNYLEWAAEDLAKIHRALEDLQVEKKDHKDALARIFQLSHDMKGQGGSFGYPLITTVGESLCKTLLGREALDETLLDLVGVHVESMRLIISLRLMDDGGREGAMLISELEKVCAKVAD